MENINDKLVNHPSHYNHAGRRECWDEMIEYFGEYDTAVFDIVTAYKYYYRAGTKTGNSWQQDIAKAQEYLAHAKKLIPDATEFNPKLQREYVFVKELIDDFGSLE